MFVRKLVSSFPVWLYGSCITLVSWPNAARLTYTGAFVGTALSNSREGGRAFFSHPVLFSGAYINLLRVLCKSNHFVIFGRTLERFVYSTIKDYGIVPERDGTLRIEITRATSASTISKYVSRLRPEPELASVSKKCSTSKWNVWLPGWQR